MKSPTRPSVPDVIPALAAFKATFGNVVGGSLHIILSDGNVSDKDVRFCIERAKDKGDTAGVALGETLLLMSKTQRKRLYRIFNDLPSPEDVHGHAAAMAWLKQSFDA